ncbi:MAG: MFS transporter [Gaiellaceae bacterium]
MLGAGTFAQASFSAVGIGVPAIAPALREHFGLSVSELGLVLAAEWLGTLLTLLAWGFAADRVGERWTLAVGLGLCGLTLGAVATVESVWALALLLALAGALGASTNSASGRAVMQWFGPAQRGLVLGIRQTAIPLGGLAAAAVLPHVSVRSAFLLLGGFCVLGALVGGALIREGARQELPVDAVEWTLRDRRLWVVCFGSGLYLPAQVALMGFVVLFLHDARGLSKGSAAGVLVAIQVGAAILRISVGRWSDVRGQRVVPLRRIGVAIAVTLAAATAALSAPLLVLVPALVLAGSLSMAWNGLSFAAAAELAGGRRSGAAIGFQQSVLSGLGVLAPVAFAATVSATSWRAAYGLACVFPVAGWLVLRPLREERSG